MASTMREMAFSGVAVTSETLEERGFTPAAIARFARDARNMARRQSIRHIESA